MNRHTPIFNTPHPAAPYRQIKCPAAEGEFSAGLWCKRVPNSPLVTRQRKEIWGTRPIDPRGGQHG